MSSYAPVLAYLVFFVLLVALWRLRRRRRHIGPAGVGSVYDMLNQDRRNAVEMIVEELAEARDPEDKDGNLPDLAKTK